MLHQTMSVICAYHDMPMSMSTCTWPNRTFVHVHSRSLLSKPSIWREGFYRPNSQVRQGRPCIGNINLYLRCPFQHKQVPYTKHPNKTGAEQYRLNTQLHRPMNIASHPSKKCSFQHREVFHHKASTQHTRAEHYRLITQLQHVAAASHKSNQPHDCSGEPKC